MSNQDLRPPQLEGTTTGSNSTVAMTKSPYLIFTQVGPHWHGRSSLKNLFVFGDSYSSRLSRLWSRTADEEDPYDTDGDDATWINFFASSMTSRGTAAVVKILAFPGHTVERHLDGQLARFLDKFSENIEPGEITFVFFLGINDCGGIPWKGSSSLVKVLFDAVRRLYTDVAARNFILVDVPPADRSPAAAGFNAALTSRIRIKEWNEALVTQASEFVSSSTQATVLLFSSNKVLSEILDNPGAHGFAENAKDVAGRGIWRDKLHLTPAVHKIIASRMSSALGFD